MDPSFPIRRRTPWFLFVGILCLYFFSTSRERPWADSVPLWELGDAIANRHEINIATRWPKNLPLGKDGRTYAVAPILQGIMQAPGAYVQAKVAKAAPTYAQFAWRFTCHLAPTVLGTLTCMLFFGLCRRAGARPFAAGLATLGLAVATSVWVYARYPYSEALQLFCFTGLFGALWDVRESPTTKHGLLLGMWSGLLLNAKLVYGASLPGVAILTVVFLWKRWRDLRRVALAGLAAFAPLLLLILLYNRARFGGLFDTGYDLSGQAGLRENPLVAWYGMLFSPGKSIFFYSPPLILAVIAFPRFYRRYPFAVLAMALTIVPPLWVTGKMVSWAGDFSWGPRYCLFATAVLLLPAAMLIEDCFTRLRAWRKAAGVAALGSVLGLGSVVTFYGNAVYWDHFIRVQADMTLLWLGIPNTTGDGVSTPGNTCAVCFEQLHSLHWLPPFNQILGNRWLFWHAANLDPWPVAQKDAPWRRYTTANIDVSASYNRTRVDFWVTEFRNQFPALTWTLVVLFSLGTLAGLGLFARELWRAERQAATSS